MREIRLNWYEPRQCWRVRKTIGGKTRSFYVGRGTSGPGDESAKARARLEAERLIREAEVEANESAQRWDEATTISKGMKVMAREAKEAAAFFRQPFKEVVAQMLSEDGQRPQLIERAFQADKRASLAEAEVGRLSERVVELEALLSAQGRAAASLAVAPLTDLRDRYLTSEQGSLREAERSSAHIRSIKTNLLPLVEYLLEEGLQTTADLDAHEHIWGAYRDDLVEQRQTLSRSAAWLKARLRTAKLWAEWLVERGFLARMPRSIGRSWNRAGSDAPSPTFLTIRECRAVFAAADARLKLAVALGLNAGYRASDLQSLRQEHIDLTNGEIVRQRNKTGSAQRHKLWKVTACLLQEACASGGEPFERGWSNIAKETTELIDDAIPNNTEESPAGRRTSKSLRSTGAQVIEEVTGGTMPHVVSQWLAHGDKRLAKHYRREELKPLYAALSHAAPSWAITDFRSDLLE